MLTIQLSIVLLCLLASSTLGRVMVWMCLEFCEDSTAEVANQLDEISHHLNIVSAVSFEKYTLGPNCSLVDNELTEVSVEWTNCSGGDFVVGIF